MLLENQILCRCLKAKMNQKLSQQKNPEINLIKTTWLYKKCHLSNLLHPEENMVFQFNVYFQELDIDFCHKTDICLSPRRAKSFHNDWWIQRFLFDFQNFIHLCDFNIQHLVHNFSRPEVSLSCKSISKLSFQTFPY